MSNDPHIVAARRRARMLSRQSGLSYQHHLNEVARDAGRPDWKAFLEDPAPPGDGPPATAADEGRAPSSAATTPTARERPPRPWWRGRLPALAAAVAALALAILGVGAWQQTVTNEIADTVTYDRATHGSIDFIQRNMPIARNVGIGDMRRVDLVVRDDRALMAGWTYRIPRMLGYDERITYGGRSTGMREALRNHPIIVLRMHVNCRMRKWRMAAIAASDAYDVSAVAVEYYGRSPRQMWWALSERNRHAVCDTPDDTTVPYPEEPDGKRMALQSIPAHDPGSRADVDDALWYGLDLLRPAAVGQNVASPPWFDAEVPRGWTSAAQVTGWETPVNDMSGPALVLVRAMPTLDQSADAARVVAAALARRFELGPGARPVEGAGGYLAMTIRFSPTPRADRPRSSILRRVELRQTGEGVMLRVTLRGRHTRQVTEWFRTHET